MRHSRRKKIPNGRAKEALHMIGKLYHIEKQVRTKASPDGSTLIDEIYRWRQERSCLILDALHTWLVKNKAEVMPQSLIGKAISYALGQWLYIYRYIDDGRAPIDNNLIERDIRPFTIGRKAWLFSNSVAGADASAVIYSLMLTCRACDIEPYAYLRHVLIELPKRQSGADVTDLLPFNSVID
jgi:transposase